jgi:alkylhydroperoxidase/carboxymuconolactone decarboxylase family protein YurZ
VPETDQGGGLNAVSNSTKSAGKPEVWDQDWEYVAKLLPEFPGAFFGFATYGMQHGALDNKTRELILLATNASPSHFFSRGFLHHARAAKKSGATVAEMIGVLTIFSTVGAQSVALGATLLAEQRSPHVSAADERVTEVRRRHQRLLGAPTPESEAAISAAPEFWDRWLNLAEVCIGPHSALTPRVAHLVALAAFAQCTQLSVSGMRQHICGALAAGATPADVLEVCELIAGLGGHAIATGVPLLLAEFERSDSSSQP